MQNCEVENEINVNKKGKTQANEFEYVSGFGIKLPPYISRLWVGKLSQPQAAKPTSPVRQSLMAMATEMRVRHIIQPVVTTKRISLVLLTQFWNSIRADRPDDTEILYEPVLHQVAWSRPPVLGFRYVDSLSDRVRFLYYTHIVSVL